MERSGDDAAGTCAADIIESAGEPKLLGYQALADCITSARKLLTNRSYGVSYHLCSG